MLLRMLQLENSDTGSEAENIAAVVLHLSKASLLIYSAAGANLLLDFLLLLPDVNVVTRTLHSIVIDM